MLPDNLPTPVHLADSLIYMQCQWLFFSSKKVVAGYKTERERQKERQTERDRKGERERERNREKKMQVSCSPKEIKHISIILNDIVLLRNQKEVESKY